MTWRRRGRIYFNTCNVIVITVKLNQYNKEVKIMRSIGVLWCSGVKGNIELSMGQLDVKRLSNAWLVTACNIN